MLALMLLLLLVLVLLLLLLLLLLLTPVAVSAQGRTFQMMDRDKSYTLDRAELEEGMAKQVSRTPAPRTDTKDSCFETWSTIFLRTTMILP